MCFVDNNGYTTEESSFIFQKKNLRWTLRIVLSWMRLSALLNEMEFFLRQLNEIELEQHGEEQEQEQAQAFGHLD
jgi:hypothetical protein